MKVVVKPFSRGSSAIRLVFGKLENEEFTPASDVRKAPNFRELGSRIVSGKFGTPSYTEEYELDLSKISSVVAVQKWTGISTVNPRKYWEVLYDGTKQE